ncbi:MAG: ThiF family adenylyltransferase [Anaerolineae bacterium]
MNTSPQDNLARYSRQMLVTQIGEEGQRALLRSKALVLGVGALGTALASGLVRAGVGDVRLVDRDFIELHNLQRQSLFDEDDIAADLPKAVAAARKLRKINRQFTVEPVVTDVTHRNVERLIEDRDVVLDGSDNFEVRMLLSEACAKHGVPWIYGAVIGTYGATLPILPEDGPCFHALLPSLPAPGTVPSCDTAGVLGTVPPIIAALQVTEALKILTGHREALCRELRYLDVWTGEVLRIELAPLSSCAICHEGQYDFLTGAHTSHAKRLCGDQAVQVRPQGGPEDVDLEALSRRLAPLGEMSANAYLLRFQVPPYEIVLFRDGRAIIRGTDDPGVARALYARYIGL